MTTDPDANPEGFPGDPLDTVSTFVNHLQGTANTGSGDQYNYDDSVAGDWVAGDQISYHVHLAEVRRRRANAQAVTEDWIAWLQARFVRPGSFLLAEETLAGLSATVLLAGSAGSGRQTAAQMLLCPPDSGYRALRRLPVEPDDPADAVLDASQVTSGDRLLLDLSEADRELFERHQQELSSLRDAVQRNDARLVVVLSHNQEHWLSDELRPLRVTIDRPDPLRVLITHLSADSLPVSDHDLWSDELTLWLSTALMSQVSRLAGYILEAADRDPGGPPDFNRWLNEALDALNNHASAVTEELRKNPDVPARALLLSMAMLEGSPVVAVDHAERELLRIMQCPEDETPRLGRCHLFDRIVKLGAGVNGELRVEFTKLAYGRTVLTHFWDGYPDLHQQFSQWVQGLAELPQLTNEDRDRLADRFTDQSLRAGHIGDLLRTAWVWARHRKRSVRSLAYTVLATAVNDDRFGRSVRQRLYYWVQHRQLNSRLAEVIVAICVGVLGPSYPDQALVRLYLLAGHSDSSVAAQAREALLELAADDRFFRRLLAKLAEATEFNAELFLELVDPRRLTPLIADRSIREQVVCVWRKALEEHRNPVCIEAVRRWLQAYTDDPQREFLLDVLVAACADRPDLFARLFELNRDWRNDPVGAADQQCRHRTARHLTRKIYRARGLDFLYSRQMVAVEEENR